MVMALSLFLIVVPLFALPIFGERTELGKTCAFIDYMEKDVYDADITCAHNKVCNKTFHISYIDFVPHTLTNLHFNLGPIEGILSKCCGSCVEYTNGVLKNISELTSSVIDKSNFVYPILATSTTKVLHGAHYVPYADVPGIIYVTARARDGLFQSLFSLYPLIIACILLAVVSGFVAWILETWSNENEFPRGFLIGWFEGFWWSFISMTTVGYGDKTPKSVPARLFSVIWILIGIVAFGILTGELTGQIIKANSPPPADMKGKDVGVLRFRDYDAYVVSQNGGNIIRNEDVTDFKSDVLTLISKLREGTIRGFVLDKWTLEYVVDMVGDKENDDVENIADMHFLNYSTTFVEMFYKGDKLSYGMLVKHQDDYDYVKDFVNGNQLLVSIKDSRDWIETKKEDLNTFYKGGSAILFSPSGRYFRHTMIVIAIMLGLIIIFGIFYEMRRNTSLCEHCGGTSNRGKISTSLS